MAGPDLAKVNQGLTLLKRQQRALKAADDLMTYIKFTSPDPEDPNDIERSTYQDAKHHRAVAEAVQTFVLGGFPGYNILVLVMPPRHGKSEIVSRKLPAWYSGKFPRENVVIGTYNDDFAADFGADVRKNILNPQHKQVFPKHALVRGGTAKDRLQTTAGGMLTFVGMGGSLTGRGAHLLILDDLVKGDKEAVSKALRDQAWSWLTKVAMTRRMGRKLVILTFTRWHADDPIGRLTDPENEQYSEKLARRIKIISLPGIAEDDDALGRKPGEALWPDGPDQFDIEFLEQQREFLGPMGFASLYQQRPSVEDGTLFLRENLRYYDDADLPEELRYYAASDHAVGQKQRADPTCMGLVGIDKFDRMFVLPGLFWKKAPTNAVVEAMLTMGGEGDRRPLIWWAESGHISKSIGPFLKREMDVTGRYVNIIEVQPAGDKEQRAQSIAARFAVGKVYLPKSAPWLEKAVNELMAFPRGLHDDFVDFMSLLGLGLRVQVRAGNPTPKQTEPKPGTLAWLKLMEKRNAGPSHRDANYRSA